MPAAEPEPSAGREETVEQLLERIGALVSERQRLRAEGASRSALERNRTELTRLQARLSRALVGRYGARHAAGAR